MAPRARRPAPNEPDLVTKLDAAFGPDQPAPAQGPDSDVWEALAHVQANLPSLNKGNLARVEKEGRLLYTYRYVSLDEVNEALFPLFARAGLVLVVIPTMRTLDDDGPGAAPRLVADYRLRHVASKTEIAGVWPLPDRANPQEVGSVLTYARRYVAMCLTGLSAGDDDDGGTTAAAAGPRETLSAAATLSIPPAVAERILATVREQSETTLAEITALWPAVLQYKAADKPSTIATADGRILTWTEVFSLAVAERINALTGPAEVSAFGREATEAKLNTYPWTWDGLTPADRFKQHRNQLHQMAELATENLRRQILEAQDLAALDAANQAIDQEEQRGLLSPEGKALGELRALFRERWDRLEREQFTGPWRPGNQHAADLEDLILTGQDTYLGNLISSELESTNGITARDRAALLGLLGGRPEPDSIAFYVWSAQHSWTHEKLDALHDEIRELTVSGRVSVPDEERVNEAIGKQRAQVRDLNDEPEG